MNTQAVIKYIQEKAPSSLPRLFEGLIPGVEEFPATEAFLSDSNNWISSTLMIRMFENAKVILNDDDAPYNIGYHSVINKRFGHIQKIFIYSLGSPSQGIKRLQKCNNHFNRTKTVEIISLNSSSAVIRLHWDASLPLHVDLCNYNKGIYQASPTIWGCPPAELIETKNFFAGDEYCEFHIKWRTLGRIKSFFFKLLTPGKIVSETLNELERDKELLKDKYHSINNLNSRLERKVVEMTTLQESSSAILSTLNLEDLLDVIVSKLMDVADMDRACIFLTNKTNSSLNLIHAVGVEKELIAKFKGYEIPLDKVDNIIARSAHSEHPVFIEDVSTLSLNPYNQLIEALQPKAFILVPLNVRGEIIGIMVGDNSKNTDFIQKTDRNFLKSFANHIAMALDNAKLYKRLRESEERYREIVENVNEGIWILDKEGNILFSNRRLDELLEYDALKGTNTSKLVYNEDREILRQCIEENFKGKLAKSELHLQTASGKSKTVRLSSVPVKRGEQFSASLAIITDLTNEKNMEKRLLQTQKLEAVGTMAGGVAHDFNNILTGILGHTAILKRRLEDDEKSSECTLIIENASLKAADLVQKMLKFSSHNTPVTDATTSLDMIIEDALSLVKSSLALDVEVHFTPNDTLPLIQCDPIELQQIILNLCLNAAQAMPTGGEVKITTCEVPQAEITERLLELAIEPGEYVSLVVEDNGTGMSENIQERIFDPFFTTKAVGEGSGLGLAMVYAIIQGIGGGIHVNSIEGEGTTFKLFFRVARKKSLEDSFLPTSL